MRQEILPQQLREADELDKKRKLEAEAQEMLAKAKREKEQEEIDKAMADKQFLKDQRTFYADTTRLMKEGVLTPAEIMELENEPIPDPEKIAKMDGTEFRKLAERADLKQKLAEERIKLERKTLETITAREILKERGTDLQKLLQEMTPAERWEWEQRLHNL